MTTPYPLGAFAGTPAANLLTPFTKLMGVAPTFFNVFTDFTQPPASWPGNAGWSAGDAAGSAGYAPPMIPLVHFPMFSTSTEAPSTAAILAAFTANAQGVSANDSITTAMVQAYAAVGYKTVYWRVGVEMNLSSDTFTYTGLMPQWIAAFKSIARKIKAVSAQIGIGCKIIWNPGCAGAQLSGDCTKTMWAGTAADMGADLIGGDCYDSWINWVSNKDALLASVAGLNWQTAPYPTPMEQFYNTLEDTSGNALTLPVLIAFAAAQGLPICIPETGCGAGPSDNPWFVRWLRHQMDAATAAGVPVAFVSPWDSGADVPDLFTDGSKPNEAAAWAYYFGVNAAAPPKAVSPPVATPPVVAPPATSAPSPTHAASPAGTQISPGKGAIVDTRGQTWTISAGEQLQINGTVVGSSWKVVTGWWSGSQLYQLNSSGNWYNQPLSDTSGTPMTSAPAGFGTVTPTPVLAPVHAASAAGTQLPPVPGPTAIYDGQGGAWTLTPGQQIAKNGVVVPSSAKVVALFWTGTQLDQLNTSGKWWTQPLDGSAGTELAGPPAGYVGH